MLLDISRRAAHDELMDDFTITDRRLVQALEQLPAINSLLGGYSVVRATVFPLLRSLKKRVRILDLGTGIGDFPELLVRWADKNNVQVEIVGTDANPFTVAYARQFTTARLPVRLRDRVTFSVADVRELPFEDDSFDVVIATQLLHHFRDDEVSLVLRNMERIARKGILVNDLHRNWLAFYGIRLLTRLLPFTAMIRNDAPLSVRRGFGRSDLSRVACQADLQDPVIRWHWPFRWSLSTLNVNGQDHDS